ncbi:MAG: hypothetical protein KUG77_22655 [Nannocystaceae bacterium]|nr:hypothetical protein [Nannocystaceae bacterium]
MMKLGWLLVVPALLLAGCDSSDSTDVSDTDVFGDDMPGDFPAGSCAATMGGACETDGGSSGLGEGSSTAGDPADCVVDGCVGQGVCVAPWDESAEQLGEFECRFSCVPLLDDASWCANDDTCCDAQARCTDRGYCVLDGGDGSTGSGGGETGTGGATGTDGITSGGGA